MRAYLFVAAVLASLAPLVVAACSSESTNPTPPNTIIKIDSGTAVDTAIADTGTVEDSATVDAVGCNGDGGCWGCKPTNTDQFLNQCTTIGCAKFDEKTRIPSAIWDGGALPPVP